MSDGKKGSCKSMDDEHAGSEISTTYYNRSIQISSVEFYGLNYLGWSWSCFLFIQARGLQDYINGKTKLNRADLSKWKFDNSVVPFACGYLLLGTTQKIYEAASHTYSQGMMPRYMNYGGRFMKPNKSCIKVALDFVSPENVEECIRLTEEFRILPQNHRAQEDKLEVKKMALYAITQAVKDLDGSSIPE